MAARFSRRVYEQRTETRVVRHHHHDAAAAGSSGHPPADTLEVVLSFDTTGSMYKYLDEVRQGLRQLVQTLVEEVDRAKVGLRLGVIAHGDYCDKDTSYVIKYLPLLDIRSAGKARRGSSAIRSDIVEKLLTFIEDVGPTYGGDAPECYELALQKAANVMHWGPRSRRLLVIVGDSLPHEPGYEYEGFTNPIDWRLAVQTLKKKSVHIIAVQASAARGSSKTTDWWKALASETDGRYIPVEDVKTLPHIVAGTALRELSKEALARYKQRLQKRRELTAETVTVMRIIETTVRNGMTTTRTVERVIRDGGGGGGGGGGGMAAIADGMGALRLEDSPRPGGGSRAGARAGASASASGAVCAYFGTHEGCRFGQSCRKSHVPVCKFFNEGHCKKGNACEFLHTKVCHAYQKGPHVCRKPDCHYAHKLLAGRK